MYRFEEALNHSAVYPLCGAAMMTDSETHAHTHTHTPHTHTYTQTHKRAAEIKS